MSRLNVSDSVLSIFSSEYLMVVSVECKNIITNGNNNILILLLTFSFPMKT